MTCEEILDFRNRNNKFAKYLGIRTTQIRVGYAKGEMEVAEHHENSIHSLHGGCLFSLADTIGGAAAAARGFLMTTVNGNFHFLNPAINTKILICEAKELKYGKNIAVYDVIVSDQQGKLFAKGTFSFFNLGKQFEVIAEE